MTSKATQSSLSRNDDAPTVIRFPVETDIIIGRDGEVIIADLPQELEALRALLGHTCPDGETASSEAR